MNALKVIEKWILIKNQEFIEQQNDMVMQYSFSMANNGKTLPFTDVIFVDKNKEDNKPKIVGATYEERMEMLRAQALKG